MSPAQMRGPPAIAGNRASREIKSPPAVAGTVAAVVMRIAAVVAEMEQAARIAAAGKRANEDFR
jgi:hypothetical protein